MTGAAIIGAILSASTTVQAAVPANQMKLGRLPSGISLPVLLIRTISSVEDQRLKRKGYPEDVEGADSIVMANPTIEINTKVVKA